MRRDPTVLVFGEGVATKRQDLLAEYLVPPVSATPRWPKASSPAPPPGAAAGLRPVIDLLFALPHLRHGCPGQQRRQPRFVSGGQFSFPW